MVRVGLWWDGGAAECKKVPCSWGCFLSVEPFITCSCSWRSSDSTVMSAYLSPPPVAFFLFSTDSL